jgi:hypothetical protein
MAYELYYTAHFTNEESQSVEIFIYQKDAAAPDEVENYELHQCQTTDNSEGQTKYECIIVRELLLSLETREGQSLTWETFITAEHDEWKIDVLVDSQYYFQGFITPDEGNAPFQDKPYAVTFRATNGLALLKGQALSDVNGDEFTGNHSLIEYISGAAKKLGLDLPIRIYCGYFHLSMLNKGNDLNWDMFQQAKLNYRTFQKSPTAFVSCYEGLKIILDKFCTIEYWKGMLVISAIGEKQYNPNPDGRYYVDYDSEGAVTGSGIDTDNYGRIGKQMDIYPINETQQIYSRFAVKSVRSNYDYEPWPELPKNNKFERGIEFDDGDQPDTYDQDDDGDNSEIIGTFHLFDIPDWATGSFSFSAPEYAALPNFVTTNPDDVYRKTVKSLYGVELYREIYIEHGAASGERWLRSEGIPVRIGDKFSLSFDWRFEAAISALDPAICSIYIISNSGLIYALRQDIGMPNDTPNWEEMSSPLIEHLYGDKMSAELTEFSSFSLTVDKFPSVPIEGTMYIAFVHALFTSPVNKMIIRSFEFEYFPYIANGYLEVKGDYWFRNQTANFPDVSEEDVRISDAPTKILKGALLFNDQLTDPAWYRHGPVSEPNILDETRHFKELLNIARFNHSYRRMYAIEGDFNGLNWSPENDAGNKRPIGFYTKFREVDMTSVRDFVLVPPLTMDISKAQIKANLVEVYNSSADGTQAGTSEFKYIF